MSKASIVLAKIDEAEPNSVVAFAYGSSLDVKDTLWEAIQDKSGQFIVKVLMERFQQSGRSREQQDSSAVITPLFSPLQHGVTRQNLIAP